MKWKRKWNRMYTETFDINKKEKIGNFVESLERCDRMKIKKK